MARAGVASQVREITWLAWETEGSPLLRWALVEAAWRVIRQSAAWRRLYQQIRGRAGSKKAIVAVARRPLAVMTAMLREGTNSNLLKVGEPPSSP